MISDYRVVCVKRYLITGWYVFNEFMLQRGMCLIIYD